jgi:hypothetical protein
MAWGEFVAMRITLLAVTLLIALSACARTKLTDWDKPGLTMVEFYADSNACRREATSGIILLSFVYNECMEARGYMKLASLLNP